MRKFVVIAIVVAVAGGAAAYFGVFSAAATAAAGPQAGGPGGAPAARRRRSGGGGGGFGGGGFGGPGGGGGPRVPMTVELGNAKRGDVAAHLTVVGNLIGQQTVDIAPRTGGRLLSVNVQLGDRVRRGQVLAKVEDREIVEQVRPGRSLAGSRRRRRSASAKPTQGRRAQLRALEEPVRASCSPSRRSTMPRSRYTGGGRAARSLEGPAAQNEARLQELRINLQQHQRRLAGRRLRRQAQRRSGRDGLTQHRDRVGRRHLAPAAGRQRRREGSAHGQPPATSAIVEVDAYPGEKFNGRIARVAPVLDPATRTAPMEVEIPNRDTGSSPACMPHHADRRRAQERAGRAEDRGGRLREQARRLDAERREPRRVRAGQARHRGHRAGSRSSTGLKEGDRRSSTTGARGAQLSISGHAGEAGGRGGGRGRRTRSGGPGGGGRRKGGEGPRRAAPAGDQARGREAQPRPSQGQPQIALAN